MANEVHHPQEVMQTEFQIPNSLTHAANIDGQDGYAGGYAGGHAGGHAGIIIAEARVVDPNNAVELVKASVFEATIVRSHREDEP